MQSKRILKKAWQVGVIILLNVLIIIFFTRTPAFSADKVLKTESHCKEEQI